MTESNFTNEALNLAAMGFRVFPVKAGQKAPPCIDEWQHHASDNEDRIGKWWSQYGADSNIAILTDGLLVLDIDVIQGDDGSWHANNWIGCETMAGMTCPSVVTPSGGHHYFFRQPPGADLRNTSKQIADGVDTRANGGYVVAAPSMATSKATGESGSYQWINRPDNLEDIPFAPNWLVALVGGKPGRETPSSPSSTTTTDNLDHNPDHYQVPNKIKSGGRNSELTRLAGGIRGYGASEREILGLLRTANVERCDPPMDDKELSTIAWSVCRYEPDQAREFAILGFPDDNSGFGGGTDEDLGLPDSDFSLTDPGPLPPRLLYVPGVISDIMDYNASTAPCVQPDLALGASITLMGAMISGKVMDRTGMRTNIYTVGVCPTGSGKDHGRKVNKEILEASNWSSLLGPEDVASGPAIGVNVAKKRCSIWHLDEFGKSLKNLNSKNAQSYQASIIPTLLKMYTSSSGTYISPAYADEKRESVTVREPHLSIYGTAADEQLLQALSKESVSDGLLARLMIFEGKSVDQHEKTLLPVPGHIISQVEYWRDYNPGGNLCTTANTVPGMSAIAKPFVVPYDQSGEVYLASIVSLINQEKSKQEPAWELFTRVIEKTKKLALIYACSRDPVNPIMDEIAIKWAFEVIMHQTQRLRYLASTRLADSQGEEEVMWVKRLIDEKSGGEISERNLNMKLKKKYAERWMKVKLLATELLSLKKVESCGNRRPGIVWRSPKCSR